MGTLAIRVATGKAKTNALTGDEDCEGELVEAAAEDGAELVSEVECKEASNGLGWKFGKRSLTSSINVETCLIWGAGPMERNQAATSPSTHASLGGLAKELNIMNGQSPGKFVATRPQTVKSLCLSVIPGSVC